MNEGPVDQLHGEGEWRCHHCGKLLGYLLDGRLHLRLSRRHAYLVGFPATTVCSGCRALNEAATASSAIARANAKAAER